VIVIGELINGMYKDVGRAISNRETDVIQHLAEEQVRAGAMALDVNTGPYSKDPAGDMGWLVGVIQKSVGVPLSLDSTRTDVIEAGLRLAKSRAIINSTSADADKMKAVFELAKKYDAQVIGLTMDRSGVPNSKDRRLELAATIVARAMDFGISARDLYLDPIVMPVNVAQPQAKEALEAIREFGLLSNPAPHTVIGLSNISQGAKSRSLLNRTFLAMAVGNGLSAAILDPLDKNLMDAMITSELLLNRNIYCDSFLEAYRKK
jgi:5-methyltetrahydrofolate corrinoid/iron sulfur protein methyltransferase